MSPGSSSVSPGLNRSIRSRPVAGSLAVAMRCLRARELPDEIGARDGPLCPGLEVANLQLAGRKLVADDDCEVRAVARCPLQLPTELADGEISTRRDAAGAELRPD